MKPVEKKKSTFRQINEIGGIIFCLWILFACLRDLWGPIMAYLGF
jgi:hypothetical protein